MSKCIVLMGPPCSGKSTIGKELASSIGYNYISSGDIARKMAEEDGTISNLNAGKMAPEDRMRSEIIKVFNGDDIILDGFPRFMDQFEWLMLTIPSEYMFAFVMVDTTTLTLFNRVAQRGRTDDVAFMDRLRYYMENTVPMINKISRCNVINDGTVSDVIVKVEEYLHGCGWL